MVPVSNDFKQAMKEPVKEIQAFITSNDVDIRSDNDLIQFKISADSGLCKTAMRKIEAKIIGDYNLLGQWVHAGFGVKLPSGTYEYLDYGSFLVSEITTVKDTGVTTITGYDSMIRSMVEYQPLQVTYPIGLYDYTVQLCRDFGMDIENDSFNVHNDWVITKELWENIDGITYRDILQQIAQVTCTTVIITNDDRIYFKPITETEETLTYDNMFKLKLEPVYGEINSVVLSRTPQEDNIYMRDEISINKPIGKNLMDINNGVTGNIDPNGIITEKTLTTFDRNATGFTICDNQGWRGYMLKTYHLQAGETYTLSFKADNNHFYIGGFCFDSNNGLITSFTILNNTPERVKTFTVPTNTSYIVLPFECRNANEVITFTDIQIEKGTEATEYEKTIFQGMTEWKIENNEIIDKDRDSAMTPIYNAMHGLTYYPFETTTEGLGWYEIADNFDIVNDNGDVFNTSLFNFNITIDGSIKETLKTVASTKTETQYQYATTIAKRVKNTEIIVDKQGQNIDQLVTDMYDEGGVINNNFTQVHQDINNIISSVQNSGGANLIKNSVMFAYDGEGNPNNWETAGAGSLLISASAEAMANGGLSGHVFILNNKTVRQTIKVKPNDNSSTDKTYYTFSTRIKKNTTGSCYVRLYNSIDNYRIDIPVGESAFYKEYTIQAILPKDDYFVVEFYGSADSDATFTDNMLAVGEYKSQWTQANGEVMNTQVNINLDGILIKSSVYLGDYTVMSPLEFAGYSSINGTITKVFSLNKDTTLVKKLEAEDEFKMTPIKIVPITSGNIQGWAFVPSTEEV